MEDGSQYLDPKILSNIEKSEIDGGVFIDKMEDGDYLVQTENTMYTLTKVGEKFTIMGHAKYCPAPREIKIHGSTWGGSMLKMKFIGRGMRLEGHFPDSDHVGYFLTSEIKDITKL